MEEKIETLISETIEKLGYELYDVIYEKEAKDFYLRIFIDTPNGISLDDCEKVNDAINPILDEANYIKDQYFLEVSSPGVERRLRKNKHFEASIGKEVDINLYSPITLKQDEINEKKKKNNNSILHFCKRLGEKVRKDLWDKLQTCCLKLAAGLFCRDSAIIIAWFFRSRKSCCTPR